MEKLEDLKQDPNNFRKHNERNRSMVNRSLREVGAARSIVIDEEGAILAGNCTAEQAAVLGLGLKVVDVDANTLVAVRRRGLTEEEKQKLALYDNRATELSEWDAEALAEINSVDVLGPLFEVRELEAVLASVAPPPLAPPQSAAAGAGAVSTGQPPSAPLPADPASQATPASGPPIRGDDAPAPAASTLPVSQVRMVQLFYLPEGMDEFMRILRRAREIWEGSASEAVLELMREWEKAKVQEEEPVDA